MRHLLVCIKVAITRYVSDEPQPGLVECEFVDADGARCVFVEKTAVVGIGDLQATTIYPVPGRVACEVLSQRSDHIIRVTTERPYDIPSIDGRYIFDVPRSEVVQYDDLRWIEEPWDGVIR